MFFLLSFILYLINIRFRLWFIITVFIVLTVAFIIGFIQWALRQPTIMKLVSILTAAFFTMFCLLFSKYIVMIFQFLPEHVTNLDGKKYVAVVKSFKNVDVSYYNYYGPLLMGTKEKSMVILEMGDMTLLKIQTHQMALNIHTMIIKVML